MGSNLSQVKAPRLINYDAMCLAIERAHDVDEVTEIRAKAVALAAYAKEAMNIENERRCAQIRIRAERRTGELLKEMAENGQRHNGHGDQRSKSARVKLADHGISRDQSSNWQKLASIPPTRFEEELDRPGIPTTNRILEKSHLKPRRPDALEAIEPQALAIWELLINIERLLSRKPADLLKTMTEPLRKDVLRLAPTASSWLNKFTAE